MQTPDNHADEIDPLSPRLRGHRAAHAANKSGINDNPISVNM